MQIGEKDALGNRMGEDYSAGILDLSFERKLKNFDPNLRLRFNKVNQRWYVLERAIDGSTYNILFKCEDRDGNPKPFGDWVFNKLYVMRNNYEELRRNPEQWWKDFEYEAEKEKEKIAQKGHEERKAKLVDDVNQWRRAYRDFVGLPKSDVAAGYPKITSKKEKDHVEVYVSDVQRHS